MKTAVVRILGVEQEVAAEVQEGAYRYILVGPAGTQVKEDPGLECRFPDLPPGAYNVTAIRLQTDGNPLGGTGMADFVVPEDVVVTPPPATKMVTVVGGLSVEII